MTFDPNIPEPTASPKDSAAPIQVNFDQFATLFGLELGGVFYNHIELNDQNQGKHGAVIFQNRTEHEGFVNHSVSLYAKDAASTSSTEPQLFLKIPKFLPTDIDPKNALNTAMQLTFNKVSRVGPIYQSFLPGGYLLYFGSTTTIGTQITLTPTPSQILCVQATSQATRTFGPSTNEPFAAAVTVTQPNKFKINSDSDVPGGALFLWMAIAEA